MSYTMEALDSGFVIKGPVPMDQFDKLAKMAKSQGFDILDAGVAQALGATFVLTSKEGSAKLRAEVEAANRGKSREDAWLGGSDTGVSSKTIFEVMTGRPALGQWSAGYPRDPDDFGRCHRLLKIFPEWLPRLGEVAEKYPDTPWPRLVEAWTTLETLFEAENYKPMYRYMKELGA